MAMALPLGIELGKTALNIAIPRSLSPLRNNE